MRRAIFLDRDGVLNRAIIREGKPYSPSNVAELEIFPDAPCACEQLGSEGFLRIVVTNQPEVARGTLSRQAVEIIHQALRGKVPLDDVRTCYHDDADQCPCRKPRPGL